MNLISKALSKIKYTMFLIIGTIVLSQGALAVGTTPPANVDIGNQATLKFISAAGENQEIVSNIVITRIQQIYGVTLDPDRTKTILSGQTADFAHTLTNNGNGIDSFDLTHNYPAGYTVTIFIDENGNGILDGEETTEVTTVADVEAEGTVDLIVRVVTPTGQTGTLESLVTATSQGDTNQSDSATETIIFTQNAYAEVLKGLSKTSGSGKVDQIVTITLKTANNTPTNASNFVLTDTLDNRFEYVAGSAKWYKHGEVTGNALTDSSDGLEGAAGVDFFVSDQLVTLRVPTIPAQTDLSATDGGYLEFQVKVPAGTLVGNISNKAEYQFNDGVEDIPTTDTNTVTYSVLKYVDAEFVGQTIPTANPGETVIFRNVLTNKGNAPETFNLTLDTAASTFPAGSIATAKILILTEGGAYVEPLDTNNDTIRDSGVLAVNESLEVFLSITLTDDIEDNEYRMTKVATSVYDNAFTVTAPDIVSSIVAPTVDLTNNASVFNASGDIDLTIPGAGRGPEATPVTSVAVTPNGEKVVNFTLFVNNTSKFISDTFNLAVSTDSNFGSTVLPSGITVEFLDTAETVITDTGLMEPETSKEITAKVTIADGANAGQVKLYFRSKSTTSGAEDIKYDLLTINVTRKVTISPTEQAKSAVPNGRVVYTHIVLNEGNVNEGAGSENGSSDLTLPTSDNAQGYTSAVYFDTNNNGTYDSSIDQLVDFTTIGGLAPDESVTVFVVVSTPTNAQRGDKNTTTISVIASLPSYGVTAITNSATDITTIVAEELTIEKFQSLDGVTYTKGVQTANPGEPIYYKIVIQNDGDARATNVAIEDEIPQYTTLANVSGSNEPGINTIPSYEKIGVDGNGSNTYIEVAQKPGIGERGLIRAEVGDLEPGESAALYFHVKIDE
nr:hypothetical protein [uncultured Cetobacterium sp.]